MRAHRYIPTRWMLDREFLDLPLDARMLLVGLWIWPETPTSGVTVTPPEAIGDALGLTPRRVRHCLALLANAGYVERDGNVTWLKGYLEAQIGSMPNAKHKVATVRQIAALPPSPMLDRYREHYDIAPDTPSHGAADTVSGAPCDGASGALCDGAISSEKRGVPSRPFLSHPPPPAPPTADDDDDDDDGEGW